LSEQEILALAISSEETAAGYGKESRHAAVYLGFGDEDASAIIRTLEKEAGVEVKARRHAE